MLLCLSLGRWSTYRSLCMRAKTQTRCVRISDRCAEKCYALGEISKSQVPWRNPPWHPSCTSSVLAGWNPRLSPKDVRADQGSIFLCLSQDLNWPCFLCIKKYGNRTITTTIPQRKITRLLRETVNLGELFSSRDIQDSALLGCK